MCPTQKQKKKIKISDNEIPTFPAHNTTVDKNDPGSPVCLRYKQASQEFLLQRK